MITWHFNTYDFFYSSLPELEKKKRLFVCLPVDSSARCMHLEHDHRTCDFLWKGQQFFSKLSVFFPPQNTKPNKLFHIHMPRPAISEGWWSESKSDRNRKATSICPRWGRTAWMSRIDGEQVWAILTLEWTTIDGSGPSMVLTRALKIPGVLSTTHS